MTFSAPDGGGTTDAVAAVAAQGHFKRAMGLTDAVSVVVGSMIGSGIFIVSADIARQTGSAGWLLFCWVLAGVMTIMAALCYCELASAYPKAGGQYVFLREAYGPVSGFLYAWTLCAVIQTGTIAAVGVAFAKFLGVFLPDIVSDSNILLHIGNWKLTMLQLISVLLIALLTASNCRGVETAKAIQTTFTITKVFALGALIVLGLMSFNHFAGAAVNFKDMWSPVDVKGNPLGGLDFVLILGVAMVGSLFSCDAWNNITFAGEEVKDAEKILPKSLALGTFLVVMLYLLANIVYLLLIPLHGDPNATEITARGIQYATSDRVGTAAAEIIFGPVGKFIMAGAIMISTFGCLNGLILAGSRVYYAVAKDGLFFKQAAKLNPKTNVPVFSLIVQGVWSALLATSGTYGNLLDYVVFAALFFYVATVAAVFTLRKKYPDMERPFKVPFYPALPAIYLVLALATMAGQLIKSPMYSGAGLLIIFLGLPAFWFFKKTSDI
jgi:APA family basic amino acid/polyamine antiporter